VVGRRCRKFFQHKCSENTKAAREKPTQANHAQKALISPKGSTKNSDQEVFAKREALRLCIPAAFPIPGRRSSHRDLVRPKEGALPPNRRSNRACLHFSASRGDSRQESMQAAKHKDANRSFYVWSAQVRYLKGGIEAYHTSKNLRLAR
jgi:hypothetical protein